MSATFPFPVGLPPMSAELAALAAPAGSGEENPNEIVRQAFRIGHLHLLAPFATASELTEMPNVYPLPRMPANLLGLVNLHGRIVPLFDLAALFETQHLAREKRMLLVIGHVLGLTLAHDRALVYWPKYRDASRSQYWMLAVMVAFTCFGLYLLSVGNG